MDVEPLGISAVPDTRLLRLAAAWPALAVHVLRQSNIGDASSVFSNQVHVRVQDGCMHRLTVLTQHWSQTQAVDKDIFCYISLTG